MMTAFAEWKGWRFVSAVLAVLVGFYFVFFAVTRPALDWDVVGYTMAVPTARSTWLPCTSEAGAR